MSEHSRRNFLKTATLGAAAVGTAVVVPSLESSAHADPAAEHPLDSGAAHNGSFTVWVKNADAGQLVVMAGESEVVYTDKSLAKRLARIAARTNS